MKDFSNKFNSITGIEINKVLIIAFFIAAGSIISTFSSKEELAEQSAMDNQIKLCLGVNSVDKVVTLKEKKCSYNIDIPVDTDVSKSLTQFYNNLKITVTKIIST